MAKAVYKTPSGGVVTIEGTGAEVAETIAKLGALPDSPTKVARHAARPPGRPWRRSIVGYVLGLRDVGFFRTPRKAAEVVDALRKDGHLVPASGIAVVLLRLVRRKDLQRTRDGRLWKYGNR